MSDYLISKYNVLLLIEQYERKAYKGFYDEINGMLKMANAIWEGVEKMPPVNAWIPTDERLPSDDEYVIVSVIDDHGDTPWSFTTVAWLCNGVWISDNEILFGNTVAWMPMPKPYKGGEEE